MAKNQFCSISQAAVCVKLFQGFEVDNSWPGLNAVHLFSGILGFQIFHMLLCLFLQSSMGNFVIVLLDVFGIQCCVNLQT